MCSWFGMRRLQALAGVQESFSCLGKHVLQPKENPPPSDAPAGARWSVPPTPGVLDKLYHVYPVIQAKLSLLLRLPISARRGQGEFFWGKNGKWFCPWIVSGSAWVFLHALRVWLHKILRHMCNKKWRSTESCRDRHFQLQQDPKSFPWSFNYCFFLFVQATKITFILTSACPCSSWIKTTLKYSRSYPSQGEISIIQGKRSCTAEYYLVINVKTRINLVPKKLWESLSKSNINYRDHLIPQLFYSNSTLHSLASTAYWIIK